MHFWDFFTPIEETMRALDDLVRTGKIRYIGFSNTPAWKTAQAQVLAHFRGMAPIIAMQLEYSLLARTIEGEHTAMAQELGIGIMPWGALKSGILSGAYMGAPGDAPASARQSVNDTLRNISEKEQAVLDTLKRVADEVDASMASVALAWVLAQPGISATLMGLERLEQFEDNVKALDIVLSPEQLGALTLASQPVLNFPHGFVKILGPSLAHSGTTVNGIPSRISPLGPQTDAERH
jgi:aryl-alcohol dehydrogenase-like predicted oxidoreductase